MYDGADAGLVLEGEQDVVPALFGHGAHPHEAQGVEEAGVEGEPGVDVAPVLA